MTTGFVLSILCQGNQLHCTKTNDPAWLPTGLSKRSSTIPDSAKVARYERLVQNKRRKRAFEEMVKVAPGIVAQLIDDIVTEEADSIAFQEIEIRKQYVKVSVKEPACDCASQVESLQMELAYYKHKFESLTK